jgi:hypothetical protein
LNDHENAYKYFLLRTNHPVEGFIQEKIDACFEAGRISNFQLNKPWSESEALYLRAYEMDKSRPDSLYFLGIHHYLEKNYEEAYKYFREGFKVSYPLHCQYSLKPDLSFYFLPKFLVEICFYLKDYVLGLQVARFFLQVNNTNVADYYVVQCWEKIFIHLCEVKIENVCEIPLKPIMCFIVNGGFQEWTGSDIQKTGMGGSETFIVEIAQNCQKQGYFDVIVFCNCPSNENFDGVQYKKLGDCFSFLSKTKVHSLIVSRYPEYLPSCYEFNVDNVYLSLHDMIPNGEIIINHDKLKNILVLSDFHKTTLDTMFPSLQHLTKVFGYGIDIDLFEFSPSIPKTPLKFIYSSFVNRGLLQLLQMWDKIHAKYPTASLYIHCDIEHKWIQSILPDEITKIKDLLKKLDNHNVHYMGWTSKSELANTWKTADIMFYPCTFEETFCLTALEGAISKTLIVTSKLGALQNTVGDRGILIEGDPTTEEWQKSAL